MESSETGEILAPVVPPLPTLGFLSLSANFLCITKLTYSLAQIRAPESVI